MNKQIKNVVMVAAMAAAMVVGVAQADEVRVEAGVPAKAVAYKDLNLDTQAGVKVFYQRVHGAANQVCGNDDARDLQQVRAHKICIDRAMADAAVVVNNQALKAVAVAQVR